MQTIPVNLAMTEQIGGYMASTETIPRILVLIWVHLTQ